MKHGCGSQQPYATLLCTSPHIGAPRGESVGVHAADLVELRLETTAEADGGGLVICDRAVASEGTTGTFEVRLPARRGYGSDRAGGVRRTGRGLGRWVLATAASALRLSRARAVLRMLASSMAFAVHGDNSGLAESESRSGWITGM